MILKVGAPTLVNEEDPDTGYLYVHDCKPQDAPSDADDSHVYFGIDDGENRMSAVVKKDQLRTIVEELDL